MNFSLLSSIFILISLLCACRGNQIIRCYSSMNCGNFNVTSFQQYCYQSMPITDVCTWRPGGVDPTSYKQIKFVLNTDNTFSIYSGTNCGTLEWGPSQNFTCVPGKPYNTWIINSSSSFSPFFTIIILLSFLACLL